MRDEKTEADGPGVVESTTRRPTGTSIVLQDQINPKPKSGYLKRTESESKGDFKKLPWWFYEIHVLYAQVLLWRGLRELRGSNG